MKCYINWIYSIFNHLTIITINFHLSFKIVFQKIFKVFSKESKVSEIQYRNISLAICMTSITGDKIFIHHKLFNIELELESVEQTAVGI